MGMSSGRKTPGLVTLRESRVNAANGQPTRPNHSTSFLLLIPIKIFLSRHETFCLFSTFTGET